MYIRTVVLILMSLSMISCASMQRHARKPVVGAPAAMISSAYKPAGHEHCTVVGDAACRYCGNPLKFKSVQEQCAEQVQAKAERLGANYIYVNKPNTSVGGFKTRAPKAVLYQCENLNRG